MPRAHARPPAWPVPFPLAVVIAAARTVAAVTAVALFVLVCGPPVMLWSLVTRRPGPLYGAGALGVRMGFALAGIRLRVEGAEHLRPGAVYASNHASNIDPPAVFLALRPTFPRLRVVYKAELRKLPVLVWAFDLAGFVPLERGNPDQSRPAVDRAAEALAAGHSFVIFPEGTRSRTGELLPFKKGGFIMAIQAQAPVVPVAVSGSREVLKRGSMVIRPATIRVEFAPPIPTAGLTFADRSEVVNAVRDVIASRLASIT